MEDQEEHLAVEVVTVMEMEEVMEVDLEEMEVGLVGVTEDMGEATEADLEEETAVEIVMEMVEMAVEMVSVVMVDTVMVVVETLLLLWEMPLLEVEFQEKITQF